jgi:hypothetical protein
MEWIGLPLEMLQSLVNILEFLMLVLQSTHDERDRFATDMPIVKVQQL